MKALIFANGDLNDGEMVRRALNAAPDALVIAADGGARLAQALGVHIDIVIGDMDSLTAEEIAQLAAQGTEVLQFPSEKDETDLELALKFAVERGVRWLRIIGAQGGRLDQEFGNVYLLALPELQGCDARIVAGLQEIWLLHPGQVDIHGAEGDTISLLPLGGTAIGVSTQGLYYPLHNEPLKFGPARGISNVMLGTQARVTLREGVLLIVHTLGRA